MKNKELQRFWNEILLSKILPKNVVFQIATKLKHPASLDEISADPMILFRESDTDELTIATEEAGNSLYGEKFLSYNEAAKLYLEFASLPNDLLRKFAAQFTQDKKLISALLELPDEELGTLPFEVIIEGIYTQLNSTK